MTLRTTIIINETGLHARPAAQFVHLAKTFESNIQVRNLTKGGSYVSAKSIIRLLTAELCKGNTMELSAEGPDEAAAADALIALIATGFGE